MVRSLSDGNIDGSGEEDQKRLAQPRDINARRVAGEKIGSRSDAGSPIRKPAPHLQQADESRSVASRALDHDLVGRERLDGARDAVEKTHILGTVDGERYLPAADRPISPDAAGDALAEGVTDEPTPPHLRGESAIGVE